MNLQYVKTEFIDNQILKIILSRKEKHNAFTFEVLEDLQKALKYAEETPDARLVILTGDGEKSFSSGVDLKFLVELDTPEKNRRFAEMMEETSMALFNFPKPTIAAVNGYAFGGGFGLAAACDYRIMSENAKVGFPAVKIGAIMPIACTAFVMNLIGFAKTKELMLTGEVIDAGTALKIGLVNKIATANDFWDETIKIANQILEGGDLALSFTKKTINALLLNNLQGLNLYAPDNFAYLSQTDDWKNRMKNFLNNKK